MKLCAALPLVVWVSGLLTAVEGSLFFLETQSKKPVPTSSFLLDGITTAADAVPPKTVLPASSLADKTDPNLARRLGADLVPSARRLGADPEPSSEFAYQVRQRLNDMYGSVDTKTYGAETRTTLRYNPGAIENLCVYFQEDQTFKYTMGNWELSNDHLEAKYTVEMDWAFDSSTQGTDINLNIRRPKTPEGFYRLGDVAHLAGSSPDAALIVKAVGVDILEPPQDYEEVWNDKRAGGGKYGNSSAWNPIAPNKNFVCLGHVWTTDHQKPSTDLIRCIHRKYVVPVTSGTGTPLWTDFASADLPGSIWQVADSGDKTLSPGTFLSKACSNCDTSANEFYALKKQCIGGYGQFPFCLDEIGPEGGEPEVELTLSHTKDFNIHYGKLIPCGIEQEDKTIYGLKNKKDSDWEDYAVEIYQDKQPDSIFVGYRHYGA